MDASFAWIAFPSLFVQECDWAGSLVRWSSQTSTFQKCYCKLPLLYSLICSRYQLLQEMTSQFPSGLSQSVFSAVVATWGEDRLHKHLQDVSCA